MTGENGTNPEKNLPRLRFVHHETHLCLRQGTSTFWVRGPIYIFHIILRAAVIADYKTIMEPHFPNLTSLHLRHTAHSPTLPPLHLRHSSFYRPSVASPTSQLIGTLPTSELILQPLHSFTYVTQLILQPFRRFITSQVIVQPFRSFTYVTGTSPRGMEKQSVVD